MLSRRWEICELAWGVRPWMSETQSLASRRSFTLLAREFLTWVEYYGSFQQNLFLESWTQDSQRIDEFTQNFADQIW